MFIYLLRSLLYANDNPRSRGKFGEMIVSSIFDPRFFGDEEHYIINDLLFSLEDGSTHQIDHVVIYKKGIFCIETKNIEGLILGMPHIKDWKVYVGNQSYEIYNPLLQNKGHIKILEQFLNRNDIHSIVVFTKSNKPKDCGKEVLNLEELKDYVKNYECEKELSSDEMKNILDKLTKQKEEQ